jgi:hypothetical protein
LNTVEYFNSNDCTYDDFVIGLLFLQITRPYVVDYKNNYHNADGDLKYSILHAIENGVCEIDVIILESENNETTQKVITNLLLLCSEPSNL